MRGKIIKISKQNTQRVPNPAICVTQTCENLLRKWDISGVIDAARPQTNEIRAVFVYKMSGIYRLLVRARFGNFLSVKVDNETVSDPLRGLGKAVEKYGEDLPVICLIDSRLPIRLTGEAPALAGKAGFKNVRTFVLDHVSGKISEIKLGPWVSAPK